MTSLATQNKRLPVRPDRRTLFSVNPPTKQPVTPRYLQPKKVLPNKPPRAIPNQPQPLGKRKPLKTDQEVLKNEIKKTNDIKSPKEQEKVSTESKCCSSFQKKKLHIEMNQSRVVFTPPPSILITNNLIILLLKFCQ